MVFMCVYDWIDQQYIYQLHDVTSITQDSSTTAVV